MGYPSTQTYSIYSSFLCGSTEIPLNSELQGLNELEGALADRPRVVLCSIEMLANTKVRKSFHKKTANNSLLVDRLNNNNIPCLKCILYMFSNKQKA